MEKHIAHWKKRPFIYALIIGLGFSILMTVLESLPRNYYLYLSVLFYSIILLELFITSNHFHVFHKKNSDRIYNFEKHKTTQYLHHAVLPSLLYFGLVLFTYFNNQRSLYFLIIVAAVILFTVLFENIHAFYKHEFSLNKSTNYIYDALSVVLMFIWSDIILDFSSNLDLKISYTITLLFLNFFVYGYMLITRHALLKYFVLLWVVLTLLFPLVMYVLLAAGASSVTISFVAAIYYQVFNFYVNHYIEKSLNRSTIGEYLIVLMLIFALMHLYGI